MNSFSTTLCLGASSTADGVALIEIDNHTLSVAGTSLTASAIMQRALPSRMSNALLQTIADAPPFSKCFYLLLSPHIYESHLGDAVVEGVLRGLLPHDCEAETGDGVNGTPSTQPKLEECMLFASDEGSVVCEVLSGEDTASAVLEVLRSVSDVSLAVLRLGKGKVVTLAMSTVLSTAHVSSLSLASQRGIFVYLDAGVTADQVVTVVTETEAVKGTVIEFLKQPPSKSDEPDQVHGCTDDVAGVSFRGATRYYIQPVQPVDTDQSTQFVGEQQQVIIQKDAELQQLRSQLLTEQQERRAISAELQTCHTLIRNMRKERTVPPEGYARRDDASAVACSRCGRNAATDTDLPCCIRSVQEEQRCLVGEFQRREREWQLRLREALAVRAADQAALKERETTILLQSRTLAEAEKALLTSCGAHDGEHDT